MSEFEKAFNNYKANLATNMIHGGESSRVPRVLGHVDQQRDLAEAMFEAGVQSTGICSHIWQHVVSYKGRLGGSCKKEEYDLCVLCKEKNQAR